LEVPLRVRDLLLLNGDRLLLQSRVLLLLDNSIVLRNPPTRLLLGDLPGDLLLFLPHNLLLLLVDLLYLLVDLLKLDSLLLLADLLLLLVALCEETLLGDLLMRLQVEDTLLGDLLLEGSLLFLLGDLRYLWLPDPTSLSGDLRLNLLKDLRSHGGLVLRLGDNLYFLLELLGDFLPCLVTDFVLTDLDRLCLLELDSVSEWH